MALATESGRPWQHRQLFGRRVGRGLTEGLAELIATRLPELRLDLSAPPPEPLTDLFGAPVREIWLEIGFGGGEHLLRQAETHSDIGFIGCEPFLTGVAKFIRGIDEAGLDTVRLYDDDARHVLDWLPDESLSRVFVLFPDPWPKKRHRKRRFLTADGLAKLAPVMRRGAELRFASDIADYAEMVAEAVAANPDFRAAPGLVSSRPPDWPLTRYAEKAMAAGRECRFFVYERV